MNKFVTAEFEAAAFTCPHCGAYSQQDWGNLVQRGNRYDYAMCEHCEEISIWRKKAIVYPSFGTTPDPNEDMPDDVKQDYEEARAIVGNSAKGAAALLRLAIQRLMPHLGEKGKNLDSDIGNLVKNGLPPLIQKALDTVRVIGNESVHPGTIDINDDPKSAAMLFELVNETVEVLISQPKRIDELYSKLPKSKKDGISKRDAP